MHSASHKIVTAIMLASLLLISGAQKPPRVAENPIAEPGIEVVLKTGPFVHPGVLHTEADFQRMASKVAARQGPWFSSWEKLEKSPHGPGYPAHPVETIIRGGRGAANNYTRTQKDAATIYQCALRYKITGDTAQADKAVAVLNAWGRTLKACGGDSNFALGAGICGYEFASGAEIVRDYPGWKRSDFASFQAMMRKVFYGANHDFLIRHNNTGGTHYRLNWDACNMTSMLAIGVFCDDPKIFNEALAYFTDGVGNGCIERAIWYVFPDGMGQTEEMGRDQGHNIGGLDWLAMFCEIAWNQGIDLYGYDNNRFLRGVEYMAKYNLGYDVPFVPYRNCDLKYTEAEVSRADRGHFVPMFTQIYNHYVNRKGLAAPYTKEAMDRMGIDGGPSDYGTHPSVYDFLGYGTLTYTLDPIARGAAPSGVRGQWSENQITLSWWGSAYANGYDVQRASTSGGPYTTVGHAGPKDTTWIDKDVSGGQRYYYRISATGSKVPVAQSDECAVGQSLVAHYEFMGNLKDSAGNHDGIVFGNPNYVAGPGAGSAVEFDGESNFAVLPCGAAKYPDLTIATWVCWEGGKDWQRVFDFGGDMAVNMFLTPSSPEHDMQFGMTTTRGTDASSKLSTLAIVPGKWVYVAVTLAGKTATLYVDGRAVNTTTVSVSPLFTQNRCYLGRSQYSADPLFKGRLSDFRIYNYALDASEVSSLCEGRYVRG